MTNNTKIKGGSPGTQEVRFSFFIFILLFYLILLLRSQPPLSDCKPRFIHFILFISSISFIYFIVPIQSIPRFAGATEKSDSFYLLFRFPWFPMDLPWFSLHFHNLKGNRYLPGTFGAGNFWSVSAHFENLFSAFGRNLLAEILSKTRGE